MKKIPASILLLAVFTLSTRTTHGALFDFSYQFTDPVDGLSTPPGLVTGSLKGDQNGIFVENVHEVTLSFNGVSVPGPFAAIRIYEPDGGLAYASIVSFDLLRTGLLFVKADDLYGPYDWAVQFCIDPIDGIEVVGRDSSGFAFRSGPEHYHPENWHLWAVSGVPDGGLTLPMLGVAMTGLTLILRQNGGQRLAE